MGFHGLNQSGGSDPPWAPCVLHAGSSLSRSSVLTQRITVRLCSCTRASKSPTDALDHLSRNIRTSCGLGWRGRAGCYRQSLDCESTSKKRPLADVSQTQLWLLMCSQSKLFKQNHVSVRLAPRRFQCVGRCSHVSHCGLLKHGFHEGERRWWHVPSLCAPFSLATSLGKMFRWMLAWVANKPITWQQLKHSKAMLPCWGQSENGKEVDFSDSERWLLVADSAAGLSVLQTDANLLRFLYWRKHCWSVLFDVADQKDILTKSSAFSIASQPNLSTLWLMWGSSNPLGVLKIYAVQRLLPSISWHLTSLIRCTWCVHDFVP